MSHYEWSFLNEDLVGLDLIELDVRTTCICPFYINTGMFGGVQSRFSFLLPILEEKWVASRIVSAVR